MQSDGSVTNNIFTKFPDSFFHVFYGINRELMQQALSTLFAVTHNGVSYTLGFDEACRHIEDAIDSTDLEIDTEGEIISNTHDKALFVLKRLKDCGWLIEEIGENYQRFIHFQDYAVEFLQAVKKINSNETEEYSGYIFTIYQLLESVDPFNGDIALERAAANTEDLFRQLASLNTNIKKYIQKLLEDEYKDDLQALMQMLLEDYQSKIVDRAYYNLTTKDNPEKYRTYVLERTAEIDSNFQLMDNMASQRMDRKGENYEAAMSKLREQLDYIADCFESIDGLMDEIDRKNNKYIASAIARIIFLLESHEDLEGKINRILKALINGRISPAGLYSLYKAAYLDDGSLYTMKQKRLRVKQSFAEDEYVDEEALNSFIRLMEIEKRFSKKNVEEHFSSLLKDKNSISASELNLSDLESFTFMLLAYLYASDEDSPFTVEDEDREVTVNGYRFRNFIFRRRNNEPKL